MRFFGVIGNPIMHSLSPRMHNAAYRELGISAHYTRIISKDVKAAIDLARDLGFSGLNVTAPFKESAIRLCDSADNISQAIGAINTISLIDGKLKGYNTDSLAVRNFLSSIKTPNRKALLLGAGGAAKAALFALRDLGFDCWISNRTKAKALSLAGTRESVIEFREEDIKRVLSDVSVVISTVPSGEISSSFVALGKDHIVVEALYGYDSALLNAAKRAGARACSGLDWLLSQGAIAFKIFTQCDAPVETMRSSLVNSNHKKLSLIGMMGAGKSSVGKYLADKLDLSYVDTDDLISKKNNGRIEDIFQEEKESGFRKLEEEATKEAFEIASLVSCGGGAICDSNTRNRIAENSETIYLYSQLEVLAKRLQFAVDRPLLKGSNSVLEALSRLYRERKDLYLCSSTAIIDCSELSIEEIAQQLTEEYYAFCRG